MNLDDLTRTSGEWLRGSSEASEADAEREATMQSRATESAAQI